jgi:hypothetical protein
VVFGRRREPKASDPLAGVDPALAPRRFAGGVASVLTTRRQYASLVNGLAPGPVRDRLAELSPQVDEGVLAVWATVQRAGEIERIVATLDPATVTDAYKQAKRSGADADVLAAHEARFSSVQRLLNSLDDTDERLRLLEARLGGIVARAAEVALATGSGVDDLDAELSGVVSELGALRTALDELR